MSRWVGVHRTDDECDLGSHGLDHGLVLDHDGQITGALVVQSKVFGEGLRAEELESPLDKVLNGPGIFVQVAGGKALVGGVEERE